MDNPKKPIFYFQWHLTAMCDQNCRHCYLSYSDTYSSELAKPLSLQECRKVIDDIVSTCKYWGVQSRVNFTGGDPLLRKDIWEILRYAKENGVIIGIMGNPYHIDKKVAQKLKEFGVSEYQISIDGDEKTHDYFRRKGSFKSSVRALKILREEGIRTKVMFTISKRNKGCLIGVMNLVAELGVFRFAFDRLIPFGNAENLKDDMLSTEELRDVFNTYFHHRKKLKRYETIFSEKINLNKKFHLENKKVSSIGSRGIIYSGCGIGVSILVILADGSVLPCRRLPVKIGKVPQESIRRIFIDSELLNKFRDISNFKKCRDCELGSYCRGCPALSYAMTGDCFSEDPNCWRLG